MHSPPTKFDRYIMNNSMIPPVAPASNAPVVEDFAAFTVITSTDPRTVGKTYWIENGKLHKRPVAHISEGIAKSVTAATIYDMCDWIERINEGHDEVLCSTLWSGDGGEHEGEQFAIITERDLSERLGFAVGAPELAGIHDINGQRMAARLKRGMTPSCLLLIDADNPEGMPDEQTAWSIQQRLDYLDGLSPGIGRCERIEYRASSARVRHGSEPPKGASHAIMRVDHPAMIPILKEHFRVRMVLKGLSFPSPRRDRATGEVIGYGHRTVNDLAVWDIGRLIFCSKPTLEQSAIDAGYVVDDADVRIVNEGGGVLTLSGIELPDAEALAEYTRLTGTRLSYSGGRTSLAVRSVGELTLDTEIESRREVRPLGEWFDIMGQQGIDHLRCEAPFRASSSEAAFIKRTGAASGFVHDVGNGTTYLLDEEAILAANITAFAAHFAANPLPVTTPLFGVTNADIAAIPDTAVSERLAHDFRSLNLGPDVLPDHDQTRTGRPAQKQITTTPRVSYVMRVLGLKPSMNAYARQPIITSDRSPWHDPASDNSAAVLGVLGHACARCGMSSRGLIEETAVEAAGQNMFNPIIDWVRSAPWDGRSRFLDFAATLAMSDQTRNQWRDIVLRRWSIQAITAWRNFNLGNAAKSVPYVPVLNGAQGIGKTKWVAALLPDGWVKTDMSLRLDHNERDAVTRVTANPIVELAEVDASFRKSDVASLKTFLSSNVDSHRPPYGRRQLSTPRCTVYIATVNPSGFLVDATGARRFWPLAVERCHFDHGIDLQQYWAEVLTWVEADEQYWLTDDEAVLHSQVVAEHAADTPVSELVIELTVACNNCPDPGGNDRRWTWTGTSALLKHAGIGHDPVRMGEFNERMLVAGFERRKNDRKWRVPDLMQCRAAAMSTLHLPKG